MPMPLQPPSNATASPLRRPIARDILSGSTFVAAVLVLGIHDFRHGLLSHILKAMMWVNGFLVLRDMYRMGYLGSTPRQIHTSISRGHRLVGVTLDSLSICTNLAISVASSSIYY